MKTVNFFFCEGEDTYIIMKTLRIIFKESTITIHVTGSIKIFDFVDNRDFCSIGLFVVNDELYKNYAYSDKVHFCVFEETSNIIDCVIDLKEKPQAIYID